MSVLGDPSPVQETSEAQVAPDVTVSPRQFTEAQAIQRNLMDAIKQGIIAIAPSTKAALEQAEAEVERLTAQLAAAAGVSRRDTLPKAIERYRETVRQLESRLDGRVEQARDAIRSLVGGPIRIHLQGEHLAAELPEAVTLLAAENLGSGFDCVVAGPATQQIKLRCSLLIPPQVIDNHNTPSFRYSAAESSHHNYLPRIARPTCRRMRRIRSSESKLRCPGGYSKYTKCTRRQFSKKT